MALRWHRLLQLAFACAAFGPGPADAEPADLAEWRAFEGFSFDGARWSGTADEPVWAEMSAVAAQLRRRSPRMPIAPVLTLAPMARGLSEAAVVRGPLASAQERAFGMRLGAGQGLSLSTEFASGEGSWQPVDTRFAWQLARRMPAGQEGWVWGAGLGGGLPVGHAPFSQTLDLSLGRRFLGAEGTWSLMPAIAVSAVYTGQGEERWQTTFTPQVKAKVDVLKSADERLRLYLESSVGYGVATDGSVPGVSLGTRLNLIFRPGD